MGAGGSGRPCRRAGGRSGSPHTHGGRPFATAAAGRTVLLVWHSRTGLAEQMADALEQGALAVAAELEAADFRLVRRKAAEATTDELLGADGYLFCAPENLASLSGEMKEFFDRCYYQAFASRGGGDEVSLLLGRPVGVAIAAGSDGSGAARQVERICRGWRLRPVGPALVQRNGLEQTRENILAPKQISAEAREACRELGGLVAATVLL